MSDYSDQTLRIGDLAESARVLEGLEFAGCEILGPAVIVPLACSFVRCEFGALNGDPVSLIWPIRDGGPMLQGAIVLDRCSFVDCHFGRVGVALIPGAADEFLAAIRPQQAQEPISASAGGTPVAS
jgi:hypothetical protein